MNALRTFVVCLLIATGAFAVACSDVPSAPRVDSHDAASALEGADGSVAQVLERRIPLAEDEVVTRTIAPSGGAILLPVSGFSVLFPPGSVSDPTSITVTAPAGKLVGYHFLPEGLTFDVPVVATQNLGVTELPLRSGLGGTLPFAAYFEGDVTSTVEAIEILPLSLLGRLGIFEIRHFSGYVIATD